MSSTHLEDIKKGQDFQMFRLEAINDLNYKSEIKNVNNNKVLILYTHNGNIGDYLFMVLKNDNKKIFSGNVVFNGQSNFVDATKILNDFFLYEVYKKLT